MIITQKCAKCGKTAKEKSRIKIGVKSIIILECGHNTTEEALKSTSEDMYSSLISSDNRKLMPFQIEGVKFAESNNVRCLIGDEQGLGKTVQALAVLKLHPELLPAVVVTKAAIKLQWMHEIYRWLGIKKGSVQALMSGKEIAVPGLNVYITSYEMLKNKKVFEHIEPKTVIYDEGQKVKNHLSGRARAAQEFSLRCEHVLALSGTIIMNNAGEYFTILNILQPKMFPSYRSFVDNYCDSYEQGLYEKIGGLRDKDDFREKTKSFIIRRTQAEVMPDLAKLQLPRKFYHVELDRRLNKAYDEAQKELEDLFYSEEEVNMTIKIAIMTKLRQITGVSKAIETADFIEDFLDGTSRKIAVFAHHHLAVDLLEKKVNEVLQERNLNPAILVRAGDSTTEKIAAFKNEKNRVIICSGIAAGEGMDGLQHICSDAIMMERQWNPAIEEQIEKRLVRFGQNKVVNWTYMIASSTIDDMFTELVEIKRGILANTLDGKDYDWNGSSLMTELFETLAKTGRKAWKL